MTKPKATPWERASLASTKVLAFWTAAWVVTMAVASFGPSLLWPGSSSLSALAIGVNVLIGFGMIVAHGRHLLTLDELQQRIQLQAMALALGIAVVVGLAYSNLDQANIIGGDAEISHLVILIGLSYLVSMLIGARRYR